MCTVRGDIMTREMLKKLKEKFLKNELNVLMKRGVNGLYIYACDDELRKYLSKCL